MADNFAYLCNKDPFIKEEDILTPYFCISHDGWHVGRTKIENLPSHIKVHRLLDELKKNTTSTPTQIEDNINGQPNPD